MTPRRAVAHRARQDALARSAARRATAVWRERVDPGDIRGSLGVALPQLVATVAAGQTAAASLAEDYLTPLVGEGEGRVNPSALAGVASDGRLLSTLLARPAVRALMLLSGGTLVARAMAGAVGLLRLIVATQVQDAARVADLVGMAARPRGVMFVRVVRLPACARCIILSGQTYSVSEGFLRHPGCDCAVLPFLGGDEAEVPSPRQLFEEMPAEEQRRRFGEAGAEAIREGADLGQVVNARRGMTQAGTTTEGVTRRGIAGRRLGEFRREDGRRLETSRTPRLMPEEILRRASTAEERRALLFRHGYLI